MIHFNHKNQGDIYAIKTTSTANGVTTTLLDQKGYDPRGRLIKEWHTNYSQTPVTLSNLTYDETGRNTQKALGTVQTVDYGYNIRNWLTTINTPGSLGTDKFAMELFYNNSSGIPGATVQYAGNISAIKWQQDGGSMQSYHYLYDSYSRMTGGIHSGSNSEQDITYDANGNIGTLNRTGTQAAGMSYNYSGNRLSGIVKGGTTYSYAYDSNGNTTTDGLRAMTLTYNQLDLPRTVTKGTDNLEYIYDARGNKLALKVNGTVDKYYTGEVVYTSGRAMDYILTPEGMARPSGGTYAYQYNLTDHLGNVRAVVNQGGTVEQATDYYPFGMAFATNNLDKNRYLYNNKELQDKTLGGTFFGMLDYGRRMYDPQIGRFTTLDPKAERFFSWSPYVYALDNPVNNLDPDGAAALPAHYAFYISSAIDIYNAARAQGASAMGAVAVIAQAANESGYGNSSPAKKYNNFFGLMGGGSGIKTVHGELASFANAREGINAYFARLDKMWPKAKGMLKNVNISADDFNKAFNTGKYEKYPAYMVKTAGSDHDYGTAIMGMTNTVINGMISSIDTKIGENNAAIGAATDMNTKMLDAIKNGDFKGAMDMSGDVNAANKNAEAARNQNTELNKVRTDLNGLRTQ